MKCVKKKTVHIWPYSMDIYEPDLGSKFFRCEHLLPFFSGSLRLPSFGLKWLKEIKKEILGSAERVEKALKDSHELGWVPVVETGKSGDKTTQCKVVCDLYVSDSAHWRLESPEVTGKKFSCWIPTSLLEKTSLGETFAPTWVVVKNLQKNRGKGRLHRVPSERNIWPDFLKKEWIDLHLSQLPDEDQVLKEARRIKAEARRAKAAWEKSERERRESKAKEDAAAAESERRREAAKQKRFATLPRESNVSVKWKEWSRINGRYVAEEMQADGVDLIFAGKRTYIIFPDGDEIIKKSDNVEIVNAQLVHPAESHERGV